MNDTSKFLNKCLEEISILQKAKKLSGLKKRSPGYKAMVREKKELERIKTIIVVSVEQRTSTE